METLQQALIDAGIEIDHHESDLYFPNTPETREILARFPLNEKNAEPFRSAIDGTPWIDVPFAYVKAMEN